ncbi:YceD family protein [Mesorhizobium sp. IMUNJ 23232]|uniref:YceD family protein n=1 Tax=Mesorhizobium sp. IMUNJ 23232 TaxID=3376064 RepID=UPI00379A5609
MKQSVEKSPISFEVNVARLPKKGMPVTIEATEAQREALAKVHGLISVERLRADLVVTSWKRNGIQVRGRVEADIVQSCVVTLDPIEARVDEQVSAVFLPEDSKLGRESFGLGGEIMIDVDGPDSPETFSGDRIDVGALAEEFFGLGIDPYPRKQGAQSPSPEPSGADEAEEGELQKKLRKLFPDS